MKVQAKKELEESIKEKFRRQIPKEIQTDFRGTANRKKWGESTKIQYKRILVKMNNTSVGLKDKYTKREVNRLLEEIREDSDKETLKDSYDYFIHTAVRSMVKHVLFADWPLEELPKIRNGNKEKKTFSKGRIEEFIRRGKKAFEKNGIPKTRILDLVVSTVYGVRRVELAQLTKEDISKNSIYIKTRKGGEARTHIIPNEVKKYIKSKFAREREYDPSYISRNFIKLMEDMNFEHKSGYAWHAIRRRLSTELRKKQREGKVDREDIFSYFRWSQADDILDEYTVFDEKEVDTDHGMIDNKIFAVHPFLEVWE